MKSNPKDQEDKKIWMKEEGNFQSIWGIQNRNAIFSTEEKSPQKRVDSILELSLEGMDV